MSPDIIEGNTVLHFLSLAILRKIKPKILLFCRFTQTPLGIKAVVVAIYEPPQECSRDHVRLIPDENEGRIDAVAKGLGLARVGWIFTDLVIFSNIFVLIFTKNTNFPLLF